ncbi:MAG: ABC transporter ATP-binding protein [Lachnospiraceae bacterium]|nr:ABC transporter ATP-binding protein [Lachnospiraceae bacterium]
MKRKESISLILYYTKLWKKVFPHFLPFLFLSSLLFMLSSVAEMIFSVRIITLVIDRSVEDVHFIIALSIILLAGKVWSEFADAKFQSVGASVLSYVQNCFVVRRITNMPYEQLVSGSMQNRIARVSQIVRGGDSSEINQFGRIIWRELTCILGIFTLVSYVFKINSVILIVVSAVAVFEYYIQRRSVKKADDVQNSRDYIEKKIRYINKVLTDKAYSHSMRTGKNCRFVSGKFESALFEKMSSIKLEHKYVFRGKIIVSFLKLCRDISVISFVLYYSLLMKRQSFSEIVMMLSSIKLCANWTTEIIVYSTKLYAACLQIKVIKRFILELSTDNSVNMSVEKSENSQFQIEFKNVGYKYPNDEKWIIRNINLTIRKNQKIGIVGFNGAGKTTLALVLLGLLKPTEGRILINGVSTDIVPFSYFTSLFSPVFQAFRMYPTTILSTVSCGEPETISQRESIVNLLMQTPLYRRIEDLKRGVDTSLVAQSQNYAIDLSGGEAQWLMLIRALYKERDFLLLDETNAPMDAFAEANMYETYKRFTKGKTGIFVSHRLAFSRVCDRVIFVENGRIIEDGSPDELLEKGGPYSELLNTQIGAYNKGNKNE